VRQVVLALGTLLALIGLWQGWSIATDHLPGDWPDHAKWHALIGGQFLVLLSLVLLVTLWGPFRVGQPGSTLPLVLLLVGPAVMVIAGMALMPTGAPGGSDTGLAIGAVALGALAAGLAWRTGR
jgi:hypothetical protein